MNFVIIKPEKEKFEVEQLFSFYIGRHGDYRCLVGAFQGNINDMEFRLKLDRVRARMMLKSIPYHQSVCPVTIKEVKRLNDRERYERKCSRIFKEFVRRVDAIRYDLFFNDKLAELCADYKRTLAILKERYNQ